VERLYDYWARWFRKWSPQMLCVADGPKGAFRDAGIPHLTSTPGFHPRLCLASARRLAVHRGKAMQQSIIGLAACGIGTRLKVHNAFSQRYFALCIPFFVIKQKGTPGAIIDTSQHTVGRRPIVGPSPGDRTHFTSSFCGAEPYGVMMGSVVGRSSPPLWLKGGGSSACIYKSTRTYP